MIKIIPRFKSEGIVRLGDPCEFQILKQDLIIETRSFIKDQNISYLKPLFDWNSGELIRFSPETPGKYTLILEWRGPDGSSGWVEQSFDVGLDVRMNHSPQLINLEGKTRLWVPTEWEVGIVKSGHDKSTIDLLPQIIKAGWIIYDIGASLGLYSIHFSRLAGHQGHVYCLEANPICVYFLRANLEANEAFNCEIFPTALLDSHNKTPFIINYGNSNLGITQNSIFYNSKIGQEIEVQTHGLDELIEAYNLRKPDLIKIDIEGAEDLAVKGMEKTLSGCPPVIILEAHGRGAAERTFPLLECFGYRYQIVSKNREEFSIVKDLLTWFPDAVLQVICFPPKKQPKRYFFKQW